jgi:hypothetical protein
MVQNDFFEEILIRLVSESGERYTKWSGKIFALISLYVQKLMFTQENVFLLQWSEEPVSICGSLVLADCENMNITILYLVA